MNSFLPNSELYDKFLEVEERSKTLQAALDLQSRKVAEFNSNLQSILEENKKLSLECEKMREDAKEVLPKAEAAAAFSKEICELKKENETLKQKMEDSLREKDEKIRELQSIVDERDNQALEITNALQIHLELLQTDDAASIEDIREMIEDLASIKQESSENPDSGSNEKVEELEDKLETTEISLITLQEEFDRQKEELENSSIIIENLQKEKTHLKQNQTILQNQLRENQFRVEKTRKEAAETIADLSKKVARNDDFREKILDRLKELNIENKTLRDKLNMQPPSLPTKK